MKKYKENPPYVTQDNLKNHEIGIIDFLPYSA